MSSPAAADPSDPATVPETPRKKPRTIVNRIKDRPTQWLQIEGIFDSPVYWRFAAEIPAQAPEGRRRKLPTIFYVVMPALAAVWRSFDNTEVQLRDPETWHRICRLACHYQTVHAPGQEPFDEEQLAATTHITTQNFRDARASWLKPYWGRLRGIFAEAAADVARELGYCDPNGAGSINNPVRERMLVGDGKITREYGTAYRPLTDKERATSRSYGEMSHVVDKRTGQIIPAAAMGGGAQIYKDGVGRIVIGFKNVRISVRDNVHSNSTVILDVAADSGKDEAKLAVTMFADAANRLPGTLGVIYDTALHGTHIAELARHGLISVAPITAKENPGKGRNSTKRVEKTGTLGSVSHPIGDGTTCVHEFAHHGGQVCEVITDAGGAKTLRSLGDPHLEMRPGNRRHRLYTRFTVTCDRHAATDNTLYTFPIRWDIAAPNQPGSKTLNVAENVRAVPPGGPGYQRCYGWRQTIENDNNQSDLRKFQARGRAKTAENALINEIGFAMVVNDVALQQARARRAATAADSPPGDLLAA